MIIYFLSVFFRSAISCFNSIIFNSLPIITVAGLAEPRSRVDLYDNGVLVGRLGSAADANGKFSQIFEFTAGEHILTIRAIDFSNNVSQFSNPVEFVIDLFAPSAPIIIAPKNNTVITDTTPQLFGVADALSQVEIVVDGINMFRIYADSNGSWSFILPSSFALGIGEHSFIVRSVGLSGKISKPTNLVLNIAALPIAPILPISPGLPSVAPSIPVPAEIVRETSEAIELPGMPIPKIVNQLAVTDDIIKISGTALPDQDVLIYVHSDQALIYRAQADVNGFWEVGHSQSIVELAPGDHSVFAVAYDPVSKVKSRPSLVGLFTVKKNFWVMIYQMFNLQTTLITILILMLTMMWLYRLQKKTVVVK